MDLLDGGLFTQYDKDQLEGLKGAHKTNLYSERNFGHLDSSIKRRPNATTHFHSSVLLLKSNRVRMINWLKEQPEETRANILKEV